MESCEAPSDKYYGQNIWKAFEDINKQRLIGLDSYSFTINVCPTKVINRMRWSQFSMESQKSLIRDVIQNGFEWGNPYNYVFELTQKGHVHCHGATIAKKWQMDDFQEYVYRKLGLPSAPKHRVCFIELTVFDINYWKNYMEKTFPKTGLGEDPPSDGDSTGFLTNETSLLSFFPEACK